MTKAVTDATISSGTTSVAEPPSRTAASTALVSGSRVWAAPAAARPVARPAAVPKPGRPAHAMPRAAPIRIAGKIGPPRILPSAMPQASALHTTSAISAPTGQDCGSAASAPRVAWPDSAASSGERPVSSAYAEMLTPTATAHSTVRRAVRRAVKAAVRWPTHWAATHTTATAAATGTPHRKSPASGRPTGGSEGSDRAPMLSPVQCPKPMKTRAPIPLASRHGSSRTTSWGPASPAASIIITAATSGLPKMVEIAAVDPAAPSTAPSLGSAARLAALTVISAKALPMAISGASGPRTVPSGRQASAARTTPGSSRGRVGGPPRPFTGRCPPRPGIRVMIGTSSSPASSRAGSGHHHGARSIPSASGSVSHTQCCSSCSRLTNPNAASDTGTPTRADTSSRLR